MKYKTVGNKRLSCIGFGAGSCDLTPPEMQTSFKEALQFALQHGVTLIDTAEVYSGGLSETLIGDVIAECREEVFLSTKVSPENLSHDDLIRSLDGSLERLRTDYVDLLMVHWPNPAIAIDETMAAIESLVSNGKVRHIGLSNFTLPEIEAAQRALKSCSIDFIQSEYNALERAFELDLQDYCEKQNIIFMAYSPLDQGAVLSDANKREALTEVCAVYECSISQLILNFLCHQKPVVAIPRSFNKNHILENIGSLDHDLTARDFQTVSDILEYKPVRIPCDKIVMDPLDEGAYQTRQQAQDNFAGMSPAPADLAEDIRRNPKVKPVHVTPNLDGTYTLKVGKVRYWAWVIAFQGQRDILALIR